MPILLQIAWLLILAIPIACIAWTVTHEEIFAEPRNYCKKRSEGASNVIVKKFFYLFTCEYCFSFYVTGLFLFITGFRMLFPDWRGFLISFFCLVWIANIYMSLFLFIRTDIRKEGIQAKMKEKELKNEREK